MAVTSEAPKQSPVEAQVDSLFHEIERLHVEVGSIEAALTSVLAPQTTTTKEKAACLEEAKKLSPLAGKIKDAGERISSGSDILKSVRGRIEL